MTNFIRTFKFVLLGESKVGKTSYVRALQDKKFNNKYDATEDLNITILVFKVGEKFIKVNLWDISNNLQNVDIQQEYLKDSNGALIMTNNLQNTEKIQEIFEMYSQNSKSNALMVLNVNDSIGPIGNNDSNSNDTKNEMEYVKISVKEKNNLYEPFELLLSDLLNEKIIIDKVF
jgi:GTPase SAR1 family protein